MDYLLLGILVGLVYCNSIFIALISKGRTIKNLVFGTFGWGLAGTYMSFIILGNYGLAQQLKHGLDVTGYISNGGEMYQAILKIFGTLPLPEVALILLVITMIAFYSTTLDGITYVASSYSYNKSLLMKSQAERLERYGVLCSSCSLSDCYLLRIRFTVCSL